MSDFKLQISKLGFQKTDLESLSNALPTDVWITASEKHLKRQKASFVFTYKNGIWIGTLNVLSDETKEIFILHRVESVDLYGCVASMIIFLCQHKMMESDL